MARNSFLSKSLNKRFRKPQTSSETVNHQEEDVNVEMTGFVAPTGLSMETWLLTASHRFAALLLRLLPELQLVVLCQMSLTDLFNFRLVCQTFNGIVRSNQSSIVKYFTTHGNLRKFAMLYQPLPAPLELNVLLGLSHRFYVVEHIATFLGKFHLVQSANDHRVAPPSLFKRPEYVAAIEVMARSMKPYLLMLYHFIETYREKLAETVMADDISIRDQRNRIEAEIIRRYNGHILNRLCAMSDFLIKVTVRRLRAAANAGRFERLLRRWSRHPATEAQCMELLVIGTLETVNKTISISGFPERIAAIEKHLQDFSIMEKPDRRASRNIAVRSLTGKSSISDVSFSTPFSTPFSAKFHPFMQPLDQETVGRITKLLPDRDNFLKIERLATLYEPGVVLVDQVETAWDFVTSMNGEVEDFDFVAVASGSPALSSPATIKAPESQRKITTEHGDGAPDDSFAWQTFPEPQRLEYSSSEGE